jgi:hypothetical protein
MDKTITDYQGPIIKIITNNQAPTTKRRQGLVFIGYCDLVIGH